MTKQVSKSFVYGISVTATLTFLYTTSKITFYGASLLSKQVGGQARLPCCLVTWIKRDQQQR